MKRALAVCTVLAVLGFSAFGIGTFSGKWTVDLGLMPAGLNSMTLTLNYTDFGFTFTSYSKFTNVWVEQTIGAKGALGPFSIDAVMAFDPTTTSYKNATLTTSLDFAGLTLGLKVYHDAKQTVSTQCTDLPNMQYTLTAKVDPIAATLVFTDCCTGIFFDNMKITLKGIGLCCGISLDAEFAFSKANGFEYLSLSGIEIPLCCGVSIAPKITFRTGAKEVTTDLKFAGFGDACFTVFADAMGNPEDNPYQWLGIEIYGWKIKCTLGDCNYVEFLTLLKSEFADEAGVEFPDSIADGAYEYMKLGFCGAGCCGGQYNVTLTIYWGGPNTYLFGISLLEGTVSIPIMSNFSFTIDFTSYPTLDVGWVFTF